MKRNLVIKRLQKLHREFVKNEEMMDSHGLCAITNRTLTVNEPLTKLWLKKYSMFREIFSPSPEERQDISSEGTSLMYWGSDKPENEITSTERAKAYTVRRQNMMLLFIELLKDDQYVRRHLYGAFES